MINRLVFIIFIFSIFHATLTLLILNKINEKVPEVMKETILLILNKNNEKVPEVMKETILLPLVEEFEKETGIKVKINNLMFLSSKRPTVGFCDLDTNDIYIDPIYYVKSTYLQRKSLIYHEIIHCSCNLQNHDNKFFTDNCPSSILNTRLPSLVCLKRHWDLYIKDIKQKCK